MLQHSSAALVQAYRQLVRFAVCDSTGVVARTQLPFNGCHLLAWHVCQQQTGVTQQ